MENNSFRWTERRTKAAQLVAEDRLTNEQIAAEVPISLRQLNTWRTIPSFRERVDSIVEATRLALLAEGIANKQNRIDALNDRWRRLRQVIDERAEDPAMDDVPGGRTGLLVHQIKMVGAGRSAQIIDEYEVDTGLLKEAREHEKQAAIEVGQWTEKVENTGTQKYAVEYINDWRVLPPPDLALPAPGAADSQESGETA